MEPWASNPLSMGSPTELHSQPSSKAWLLLHSHPESPAVQTARHSLKRSGAKPSILSERGSGKFLGTASARVSVGRCHPAGLWRCLCILVLTSFNSSPSKGPGTSPPGETDTWLQGVQGRPLPQPPRLTLANPVSREKSGPSHAFSQGLWPGRSLAGSQRPCVTAAGCCLLTESPACEKKVFLKTDLTGKPVEFKVLETLNHPDAPARSLCNCCLSPEDLY
jgi:hypothetical protein